LTDLKPSNLFLVDGQLDRVKILDFGIARRLEGPSSLTQTGAALGTPAYMAPEQARGLKEITPATDIFSLGSVLYECLTGRPPFLGEHGGAILARILLEEPEPLSTRLVGIPPELAALVHRMLSKDPLQRPASASTLLAELLGFASMPTLQAVLPSSAPAAPRLTDSEQRLLCVVIATVPNDIAKQAKDKSQRETEELPSLRLEQDRFERRGALQKAVEELGAQVEWLMDETLIAAISPNPMTMGSAADQVGQAARCALAIKRLWPGSHVALATGRGLLHQRLPAGEAVDRAARLLGERSPDVHDAPAPSGVWIDTVSAGLLGERFALTTRGEEVILHEELGLGGQAVDESRRLMGKPTPCVGREAELHNLEGLLFSCKEEAEARAVVIVAQPGTGKSRLRHEFLRRVQQHLGEITVLTGRGEMSSAGAPYGVLGQAVRRLCGLCGSEPESEQRERLLARISAAVSTADRVRVGEFLGELCGVRFQDDGSGRLLAAREDPRILRDQIRRAFLDWMRAECQCAPVLLVLDDLHFGDSLTVHLIDEVLGELRSSPFMVLALGRPELREFFPKLWQRHKLQEITLKGLSNKACERLVHQVLGKELSPAVVRRIVEQSAGNALFLEELIRCAGEQRVDGQAETVLAMLQARLSRLDSGLRRLLRAAAIFGQSFWLGGVAQVLGVKPDEPALVQSLVALVDAEFIELHGESRLPLEKEYGFRHGLLREAAYLLLTESDVRAGHLLAAEYLEAAGEPEAAIIAGHFERAQAPLRAGAHYIRAAEQALERYALDSAIRLAGKGMACGVSGEAIGVLLSVELVAYTWLYRFDRLYERHPSLLVPMTPPGSRAFCRILAVCIIAAGAGPPDWQAYMPELVRTLLFTDPDPDARAIYLDAVSMTSILLATFVPNEEIHQILGRMQQITALEPKDPTGRRWYLRSYYWNAHLREPRPFSILKGAQEGIRCAEVAGDPRVRIPMTVYEVGLTWFELGDHGSAVRCLRDCVTAAEQAGEFLLREVARNCLARVLCEQESPVDLEEAARLSLTVIENPAGSPLLLGPAHENLARLYLRRGQLAPALVHARSAWSMLESGPLWCLGALSTLLRILTLEGRTAEAVELSEKGLGIMRSYGSAGCSEVEARLAAAEVFHAAGEHARAGAELRETLRQIAIRAEDIDDPAWRTRYLTQNPDCARATQLASEWNL
jgi:hypothetical protein